jgi:flagellar basal-body rod protein FlgF
MRPSQIVASMGAFRQQNRISHLIANNLSNAQTPGFKKDVPLFQSLLTDSFSRFDIRAIDETRTLFQQGGIQKTGNPLDIAIEGGGFFKVKTPDGTRYTRAGTFILNKDGILTNPDGFPILGKKGEITLRGQNVTIETDGKVQVDGELRGQIDLVAFPDPNMLKKEGHTLFSTEFPEAETGATDSILRQGALESSNVNSIEEMTNYIDALRSFESCLKIIQSQDEMDSKAVNELGRL